MPDITELTSPAGVPLLLSDEVLNDNDKSFYVPLGSNYEVEWVHAEFTTTAGGSARQLVLEVQDAHSDVLLQIYAPDTQAGGTAHVYTFGLGIAQYDDAGGTRHFISLPWIFLPPRSTVRVYDVDDRDDTDDLVVQVALSRRYSTPFVQVPTEISVPRAARLGITTDAPTISYTETNVPATAALSMTTSAPTLLHTMRIAPAKADLTVTSGDAPAIHHGRPVDPPVASALNINGFIPTVTIT